MDRVETTILRNLIHDEEYLRKVIPFIQPDYFDSHQDRVIFEEIAQFIVKYNKPVSQEILKIEVENRSDINDDEFKEITGVLTSLDIQVINSEWLVDTTEKWCRDRAIYLALMSSIKIADGQDEKKNRDAIPTILSDALAVSFDNHIGHDYLEDYEQR